MEMTSVVYVGFFLVGCILAEVFQINGKLGRIANAIEARNRLREAAIKAVNSK